MTKVRKRHNAEFKSKIAVEAIKEQKTINELTTEYGVHATLIPAVNPVHLNLGDFNQTTGGSFLGYTPREPVVLPSKPTNRLPKTDRYKRTAYNRLF